MSRIHFSSYDVFKSFAKKVQKAYKSNPDITEPLPLGSVRTICAFAFGYRNDNDLKKSITTNRYNDLAFLSDTDKGAINDRFNQLTSERSVLAEVKSVGNWSSVVENVAEAMLECLYAMNVEAAALTVMTVKFFWPYSAGRDSPIYCELIDDFLEVLYEETDRMWEFVPACSRRSMPIDDCEPSEEDCFVVWSDLQRAVDEDHEGRFEDLVAFSNRFSTDTSEGSKENHLYPGIQAGALTFAVRATQEESESEEVLFKPTDRLIDELNNLVIEMIGETQWTSVFPPQFWKIEADDTYDTGDFYLTMSKGLKEVAKYSNNPGSAKLVPLLSNRSQVGKVVFNHKKAEVYLPNYDTILNWLPNDYDYLTSMYVFSADNISNQCQGLKTKVFAYPSYDVVSFDSMQERAFDDWLEEDEEAAFEMTRNPLWVLEGGSLINCPRYLDGLHDPEIDMELMNIHSIEQKAGVSFLECAGDTIKDMRPTSMSAIAYIEAHSGGYFHVVVRIHRGDYLLAEESYSVYGGIPGVDEFDNGLFGPGDALYGRLSKLANKLSIPLSVTSSEFSYNYSDFGYGNVFAGTTSEDASKNNRTCVILNVLTRGEQQALTDDQYNQVLAAVKKGLMSASYSEQEEVKNALQWGIEKRMRFTAPPYQAGVYGEYLEGFAELLKLTPLSDSTLELPYMMFDEVKFQVGPYKIGMVLDGPEVITQEIFLAWGRLSMAKYMSAAFEGNMDEAEELKVQQETQQGVIPEFYSPMEKELRSILELPSNAEIRITFAR